MAKKETQKKAKTPMKKGGALTWGAPRTGAPITGAPTWGAPRTGAPRTGVPPGNVVGPITEVAPAGKNGTSVSRKTKPSTMVTAIKGEMPLRNNWINPPTPTTETPYPTLIEQRKSDLETSLARLCILFTLSILLDIEVNITTHTRGGTKQKRGGTNSPLTNYLHHIITKQNRVAPLNTPPIDNDASGVHPPLTHTPKRAFGVDQPLTHTHTKTPVFDIDLSPPLIPKEHLETNIDALYNNCKALLKTHSNIGFISSFSMYYKIIKHCEKTKEDIEKTKEYYINELYEVYKTYIEESQRESQRESQNATTINIQQLLNNEIKNIEGLLPGLKSDKELIINNLKHGDFGIVRRLLFSGENIFDSLGIDMAYLYYNIAKYYMLYTFNKTEQTEKDLFTVFTLIADKASGLFEDKFFDEPNKNINPTDLFFKIQNLPFINRECSFKIVEPSKSTPSYDLGSYETIYNKLQTKSILTDTEKTQLQKMNLLPGESKIFNIKDCTCKCILKDSYDGIFFEEIEVYLHSFTNLRGLKKNWSDSYMYIKVPLKLNTNPSDEQKDKVYTANDTDTTSTYRDRRPIQPPFLKGCDKVKKLSDVSHNELFPSYIQQNRYFHECFSRYTLEIGDTVVGPHKQYYDTGNEYLINLIVNAKIDKVKIEKDFYVEIETDIRMNKIKRDKLYAEVVEIVDQTQDPETVYKYAEYSVNTAITNFRLDIKHETNIAEKIKKLSQYFLYTMDYIEYGISTNKIDKTLANNNLEKQQRVINFTHLMDSISRHNSRITPAVTNSTSPDTSTSSDTSTRPDTSTSHHILTLSQQQIKDLVNMKGIKHKNILLVYFPFVVPSITKQSDLIKNIVDHVKDPKYYSSFQKGFLRYLLKTIIKSKLGKACVFWDKHIHNSLKIYSLDKEIQTENSMIKDLEIKDFDQQNYEFYCSNSIVYSNIEEPSFLNEISKEKKQEIMTSRIFLNTLFENLFQLFPHSQDVVEQNKKEFFVERIKRINTIDIITNTIFPLVSNNIEASKKVITHLLCGYKVTDLITDFITDFIHSKSQNQPSQKQPTSENLQQIIGTINKATNVDELIEQMRQFNTPLSDKQLDSLMNIYSDKILELSSKTKTGGRKTKPTVACKKVINGKDRNIYKFKGDRRHYVKSGGKYILYKDFIRNNNTKSKRSN